MAAAGGTDEGLSRRWFLAGAAASSALVAAGCSSGGSDASAPVRSRATVAPPVTRTAADLPKDPFALGVASGDPTDRAVILWTRLAPDATALDGRGGMGDEPVEVVWEVAEDDDFRTLVAAGVATASAAHAHAVHVDATGLDPGTAYRYRFRAGRWTSPVGRTRTLPSGSPDRFALAIANCQWYETGTYAAYRHMAEEDLDLVLHLGDYIYELGGGIGSAVPGRAALPTNGVKTLADYRVRYASYKLDRDLQAVHAAHPFSATWDDHEVANNYMGDTVPGDATSEVVLARRAAAYQAWWEHLPVRLPAPKGPAEAVYRSLDVGDLARVYLLDERQDAAEPPCRDATNAALDYGDCPARTEEDRTRLGEAQERWLGQQLDRGGVQWNLLGNPVVLAGVNGATGDQPDAYYLDTWDGFPDARKRLIGELAKVENPIVLTGDYHAGMVLDVHATPFDQSTKVVAPEFMSPPISSTLFGDDVSERTPQLRQQLNAYGYLTLTVTPTGATVRFRTLDDVKDARSGIRTAATWKVAPGDPVARRA